MIFIKNKLLQKCVLLAAVLVIAITPVIQVQEVAQAQLSQKQQQLFNANINYYDYNYGKNECTTPSGEASNSNVYIVGDSYAAGMQQAGIEGDLKDNGYENVTINGHVGRSITGPGNPPNATSALTALQEDKDKIKSAGTIVIVLGTNPSDYEQSIPQFMKKLNGINSNARKYWVNTNNKQQSQAQIIATNKTIEKYADEFQYTVIDWFSKLASSPSLSDGLHPTPKGYVELNALVSTTLGKIDAVKSNVGANASNAEKIWAFLVGKGLTPIQAAGIMGNMQGEAGFEPRRVQYGTRNSRGEISKQGQPSSLDDNVPTYSGGYGIVQWTYGRFKDDLRDYARKKGVSAGDLQLQLDFLWEQLTDKRDYSLSYILRAIKKADTIEEATKAFLTKYEKPCAGSANEAACYEEKMKTRLPMAQNALKKYGGISGVVSNPNCTGTGIGGAGGWDLKGPNAMVYYSQQDPKWENTKYGNCTIGVGGCGPTSGAMIIATLTGDKSVTPPIVAKKLADLGAAPACGTDQDMWGKLMKGYDLKLTNIALNFKQADEVLKSGGLILASFGNEKDSRGRYVPSKFTKGKHLMVIRKIADDGSYFIADPISENRFSNKQSFTKEVLTSRSGEDGGSINIMWAVTR